MLILIKKARYIFWLITLLGLTMPVVFAQTIHSLEEAEQYMLENHPALKAIDVKKQSTDTALQTYSWLAQPTVGFAMENIQNSTIGESRFVVEQTFLYPSKIKAAKDITAREGELVLQERAMLVQTLRREMWQTYMAWWRATQKLEIQSEEKKLAEQVLAISKARFEVGEGPEIDILKANLSVLEAQQNISQGQREAMVAQTAFTQLFAFNQKPITFEAPTNSFLSSKPLALEKLRLDLAQHPSLSYINQQKQVAQAQVYLQKQTLMPDFSAQYLLQNFGQGFKSHGFEIKASVPLWRTANKKKVSQLEQLTHMYEWEYEAKKLELEQFLLTYWEQYQQSLKNLQAFEQTNLVESEKLLNLTLEGYEIGKFNLLEVLDAQRMFLKTRLQHTELLILKAESEIALRYFLE